MKRQAWIITIIAILGGIAVALVQNKVLPCITLLQEAFNISMATAGWLSSVFCIMGIIVAIPGAVIVNKLGVRKSGAVALACTAVGSLMGVFSSSVSALMISRIIEGAGVGLIAIAVPALITMWFPAKDRGLPMGLWAAWQLVAQAAVFFFGIGITNAYGWQGMWWFGIIMTVIMLIAYLSKVNSPPQEHNHADIETEEEISTIKSLKSVSLWTLGFSMLCFNFACFGFVTWVAPCWSETFSIDIGKAYQYISIMYLFEILFVILVGWMLNHTKRKRFAAISYFVYTFIVAAAFFLPSPKYIIPFILIYPFFEGAVITSIWTLVPQTVKETKYISMAIAILVLMSNVGMLLGPPAAGAIIEASSWSAGAIPVAVASLIGFVLLIVTKLYNNDKKALE